MSARPWATPEASTPGAMMATASASEVHVDAAEGLRSLLRSWLRPHRGISREKLPAYLGSFQLVRTVRLPGRRGL